MFYDLLPLSIGVGLGVSLLFSELFGLAAGGLVVPGYVALYLHEPWSVLLTTASAVATFAVVRAASSVLVLYGRRRTALMILVGYLVGYLFNGWAVALGAQSLAARAVGPEALGGTSAEASIIGYIIPGLIAIWLERQGVLQTLATMVTASVVVRLLLILLMGEELLV